MTKAELKLKEIDEVLVANLGARLKDQADGNLVIYSSEGKALWHSGFDNAELRTLIEAWTASPLLKVEL